MNSVITAGYSSNYYGYSDYGSGIFRDTKSHIKKRWHLFYVREDIMVGMDYSISIPKESPRTLDQGEEYCIFKDDSGKESQKIGVHEYGKIYSIPGLYETLFYKKLKCSSPKTVCTLLKDIVSEHETDLRALCVLDLGAGNGMVGEELRNIGVKKVYGIDIEENAKKAVERDRPGIYKKYYVEDLLRMPHSLREELNDKPFNCMTTVAALGFGDIPPKVFGEGFNFLSTPGWIAFNIKEDFLTKRDTTGFSFLIRKMIEEGILDVYIQKKYRHRLSIYGDPLYYIAIIGKKISDIPESWFSE
jgi:SAM-dependent methyltransferase